MLQLTNFKIQIQIATYCDNPFIKIYRVALNYENSLRNQIGNHKNFKYTTTWNHQIKLPILSSDFWRFPNENLFSKKQEFTVNHEKNPNISRIRIGCLILWSQTLHFSHHRIFVFLIENWYVVKTAKCHLADLYRKKQEKKSKNKFRY